MQPQALVGRWGAVNRRETHIEQVGQDSLRIAIPLVIKSAYRGKVGKAKAKKAAKAKAKANDTASGEYGYGVHDDNVHCD